MGERKWLISPAAPPEMVAAALAEGIPSIVAQILHNRGLGTPAEMLAFLDSSAAVDCDPYLLRDMGRAVARIRQAIRDEEMIAVYGDYDADGLTATALLVQVLTTLGARVMPYIPHRVDQGYGLHAEALPILREQGVGLVVTADCGISGAAEVEVGRALGLDFVITDHHEAHLPLPDAVAVINPKRQDDLSPLEALAGVGVAFKLAQALLSDLSPARKAEIESGCLDLVAIGTVADVVPMLGENRSLVQRGLRSLNATNRPGLIELTIQAGLNLGSLDESHIGFGVAPRLNAAGRVDDAWVAYRLLITDDEMEARECARALEDLNSRRQRWTEAGVERAFDLAGQQADIGPVLLVAHEDFAVGVVGLIAAKLCDEYGRPAIVLARDGAFCRGSARSIPGFDISAALARCAPLLEKFGGHPLAAGLTVQTDGLSALRQALHECAVETMGEKALTPTLAIDAELPLDSLDWDLHSSLRSLPPYGLGNPEPLFLSRKLRVREARAVGRTSSILRLTIDGSRTVRTAVGFGLGALAGRLPREVDAVYALSVNDWNGSRRLELRLKDVRPAV